MRQPYKPAGYNSVSPYLVVNGAAGTIEFLKKTFGATDLRQIKRPDGTYMHAEVRIDDSVLMLADAPDGSSVPSHVHLYVSDVDETYRRAIEAGGDAVQEPVQKDDEDKRGGVRDAGGTTWWISTQWD